MTELVLAADLSSERVEVDVFLWLGIIMTGFVFLDKLVRDVLTCGKKALRFRNKIDLLAHL